MVFKLILWGLFDPFGLPWLEFVFTEFKFWSTLISSVNAYEWIWQPTEENKVTTKEKLTAVVRIIETRLESNEKETRDLENQMIEEIEKIDEKIDQINSSLDDIENKNTKMDQRFRIVLY